MHNAELEEILSSYKIQKPIKLDFLGLIHDYKPIVGNTYIKGGDILLDLNGADEEDIRFVFESNRKAKKNRLTYRDIKKDISNDLHGIKIPVEYKKDKLLSYMLMKGQESAGDLKGVDRVRAIGDKAYDLLTSYVLREDVKPERDGFIYNLEYFFRGGAIECFKISTIITLVLSMDEELRKEGIKFRLGLRDLYIYDKIDGGVKKDAGKYNPHAWVNVYLADKSIYIFDKIYGVFADVASAKKGVSSLEHPEKIFVYHFNPREGIALRRIKRN